MNADKVLAVIEIYRKRFEILGIPKIGFSHKAIPYSKESRLAHCHEMLDKMEKFIAQDEMEKVFRWLGFIQGCFWSTGLYTLEDMKNHNRSQ